MLTADLVNARRRGAELFLTKLDDGARARALGLAAKMIALLEDSVGRPREDVEAALSAIETAPRDVRMKEGLAKLLDDRATWSLPSDAEPEEMRREVFLGAARARAALGPGERFDRDALLTEVGRARGLDAAAVERALYADLRGAAVLTGIEAISAPALLDIYERGQAQAVLLRAVRIKIGVRSASPAVARALFRRLKFLGLLHTIAPAPPGYQISIDGPLSLFESVTKYGQKMALVLPVLEECPSWTLEADIRWGKERLPLTFRASGGTEEPAAQEPPLPDDIAALARSFRELGTNWKVHPNADILDLPGTGLCVPDLTFSRGKERIYLEVLGFWSRDAVFRRVDLVERGLGVRILFAVSSRLRVSAEVLDENKSGALYVYKGAMNAKAVADHLDRLSRRDAPPT